MDIDFGNVDISNVLLVTRNISNVAACDEGPGMFAHFLTAISLLLVAALLPFSLVFVVKVVQVRLCTEEYSGKMECMKNQVCKWGIQVYSFCCPKLHTFSFIVKSEQYKLQMIATYFEPR